MSAVLSMRKTRATGRIRLSIRWMITLVICLSVFLPLNAVQAQTPTPSANQVAAKELLAKMSPEEKVGQLFLVTFTGTDTSSTSQIYDLVVNRHVGGVMLSAANGNFPVSENLTRETFLLTNSLQQILVDKATDKPNANLVPLFIGISQEGDQFPNDQILAGLTAVPNAMAIGATWKPELSKSVGSVVGDELRRLGFNLYFGPSLDVLDSTPGAGSEDLGVRSYGGDPYWVGEMSKAFITGLHEGSDGRMIVISKHFPGSGGSDRPAESEVATVRKSLEQLKQIELAPFFAATSTRLSKESRTDGLAVSHIRYQGFQGNIRATTKPVSFDGTALSQLLSLPEFQPWRDSGGLLVSDDLGSQAIRTFFDPSGTLFDGRQIARNALLAGNDLLYVNNFVSTGDANPYETISKTLDFFTQKYREDPAFAQRVNVSVERILSLKYDAFSRFDASTIILPEASLSHLGEYEQVSFDVAQQAVTLISPGASELADILPRPPEMKEKIVFLTDVVTGTQCEKCPELVTMSADSLQRAVLRLYGPQAGGQVSGGRLNSYSFHDLELMLNGSSDTAAMQATIREADWIVFSFQKISSDRPISLAMKRFLSERQDLVRNKKLVAFAFNAPYYLDSTDISKLTAYYALYSKIPMFVDVAARVLFQEIPASGVLPVSVPGTGYDLIKATSPDPAQIIQLSLDLPDMDKASIGQAEELVQPTKVPLFKVGDNLPIKTGIIQDHNHNPVPDGTVVRFTFTLGDEKSIIQQEETTTVGGVARTTFRIQNPGLLEINVVSEPALTSQILRLDVTGTEGAQVTAIAPTPVPTQTEEPAPTFAPTPTIQATTTPGDNRARSLTGWLAGMMVLIGLIVMFYQITSHKISVRWGVRFALLTALAGSFGLVIYGLTPIGQPFPEIWNALVFTGGGGITGSLMAWLWYAIPRLTATKSE